MERIQRFNYSLSLQNNDKECMLKFISKLSNLKKLCLTFEHGTAKPRDSVRFLRKLLTQNKRIVKIKILLTRKGRNTDSLIKCLSLARNIQHIDLRLQFFPETTIETLAQLLSSMYRRHNWPKLASQTLAFDIRFNEPAINEVVANVAENLLYLSKVTSQKHTNLELFFYFRRHPQDEALRDLADALRQSSEPCELGYRQSFKR